MKTCSRCKNEKSLDQFHLGGGPGRRQSVCKACVSVATKAAYAADKVKFRLRRLKNTFGLSLEDVERMYAAQNGRCAICYDPYPMGIIDDNGGPYRSLGIDHCHTTGKVRELLCGPCNIGIGKFKHDPEIVERAADYLRRHAQ